jgi:hypothetical protein
VYASITYEEGAVKDLDGNLCSTYSRKADTLQSGAPSRGITVRVPTKSWALQSEFEEVNPDTVAAFTDWSALSIPAIAKEGVVVKKKIATVKPTVVYAEIGKSTTVQVKTWDVSTSGVPEFKLPEAPARGAMVDLKIPAGAFEDVYGNTSLALDVKGNYLYSYGYTLADVVGTWDIAMNSNWDGPLTESGITIEKSATSDTLLIKNLLEEGTEIKAVLNSVLGKFIIDDEQLLLADVDFGADGIHSIYFIHNGAGPVVLNVPTAGKMLSTSVWGYYILPLDTWYDAFTASTWTRKSTDVTIPQGVKSKFISKKNILTGARRSLKK